MITDNRTNEPTPEQVEVAAVASINSHRSRAGLPTLATLDDVPNADEWRDDARAALVAAQGVAPQSERDWRLDVVPEPWTNPDPVLPSSGVDEDALAEVIRKLRFDDAGCWADGIDCTESVSDHADVIARAVAEWLKGQER
jgi:hypothetical protein